MSDDVKQRGSTFRARIDVVESMGSELYAHFTVDSRPGHRVAGAARAGRGRRRRRGAELRRAGKIVARFDPESRVQEGQEAELWVDADRLHLFDPEDGRNLTVSGRAPAATGGGDVSQGG